MKKVRLEVVLIVASAAMILAATIIWSMSRESTVRIETPQGELEITQKGGPLTKKPKSNIGKNEKAIQLELRRFLKTGKIHDGIKESTPKKGWNGYWVYKKTVLVPCEYGKSGVLSYMVNPKRTGILIIDGQGEAPEPAKPEALGGWVPLGSDW